MSVGDPGNLHYCARVGRPHPKVERPGVLTDRRDPFEGMQRALPANDALHEPTLYAWFFCYIFEAALFWWTALFDILILV